MSDFLTREFRDQLTTTMDLVQRRAIFEIMKIFENSLRGYQMELLQKGEEIAQLQIKLQRTELQLRETVCGSDRGAEMNETQREPEDVLKASGQTFDVPEIDFEVPDDWCSPVGCENVTKQDENACPSVSLRPLHIPLWHVPLIKQEVVTPDIDSHQPTNRGRRSRKGSLLNKKDKPTQDRSLPKREQGTRRPPVRNSMKKLLQVMKEEYTDLTGDTCLRRRGRHLTGEDQKNTLKRKIKATKFKSTEKETVKNDRRKRYSCKFCKKVFDTDFGRSVHVRSHKRCRGCKKDFPYPSSLRCHKPFCRKLKNMLEKQAQSTDPPKPQSCDEEKLNAPSEEQVITKEQSTPSYSSHSESSIQKEGSTKKHSCTYCNKEFLSRCRFEGHMRIHTGEKPFPCCMCPKKFHIKQSLKLHMTRMHKDFVNSSEINGDLAWTKPLEVTEDNQEDSISPTGTASLKINHNNLQRDCSSVGRPNQRWQTMGIRCSNGYICLLCQKLNKNKYLLIEHYRTHTGEKPIQCDMCSAKFRFRGQLSVHKKKCPHPVLQCDKCDKKFSSQTRYNNHVAKFHGDRPYVCKVCEKAFFTKGHLRNHMERYHKPLTSPVCGH